MALLHGAQDGQKFMGVFLLGVTLAGDGRGGDVFFVPLWPAVFCAALMALGTLAGGRRIIDTVGRDMTSLTPQTGLAADLGAACALVLCTLPGLPVSTTHAKTAAILGAGGGQGGIRWRVVRSICLTWLLTFPGCGALAFFSPASSSFPVRACLNIGDVSNGEEFGAAISACQQCSNRD